MFHDLENASYHTLEGATDSQDSDLTWAMMIPRASTLRYDKMIGDAYLDAENNNIAPAWKAVLLSGEIISNTTEDAKNHQKIVKNRQKSPKELAHNSKGIITDEDQKSPKELSQMRTKNRS